MERVKEVKPEKLCERQGSKKRCQITNGRLERFLRRYGSHGCQEGRPFEEIRMTRFRLLVMWCSWYQFSCLPPFVRFLETFLLWHR